MFMLGEFRIFSLKLALLVSTKHFLDFDSECESNLPSERLTDVDGVLIRSHPVGEKIERRLSFKSGMIRYISSQYKRFYIDLKGSFEKYLTSFSSKSRSSLRRKVRKFVDYCHGNIDFRVYQSPAEISIFHHHAREVSVKTYQERLLGSGFPDSNTFLKEAMQLAATNNVRAFLIFHDHCPIAYLYCPSQEGILFYRYVGYDPIYACWSPGTVLQYLALEYLFMESNFRYFDFTEGEGQHKEFFSTGCRKCADIYYLKRTMRNLIIVVMHCFFQNLTRMIVQMLEFLHIKKIIKRMIRGTL